MDTLPLELFLQALGDPSLYESAQYLRVNRRWFHFLSPRIWKHAADHRLLKIQPHRRQLYSPLIQQLELTSQHSEDHEDLGSLDLPQLTTLKVRISYSKGPLFPTQCLRCYLAPTLTGIELGCVADPTLLGALTKHCPWLRRVELNLRAARLAADPDAVLHYLQTSPSLVHISLTGHNDITPQILHALATKPGLKQLDIKMPLNPDIVDAAGLVSAPDPFAFPALESLVLGAEVGIRVLSKLLPYVRSMKHLCMGLPRSLKAVPMTMPVEANPGATNTTFTFTLQDLSTHLPNLRTLNLKFHTRTEIHLPELLSLALFTKLEELHLASLTPVLPHPKNHRYTFYLARLSPQKSPRVIPLLRTREPYDRVSNRVGPIMPVSGLLHD
ncbi:hypothetical protein BJX68DRAFT_244499 [Aspergillus pseudodeflectus]|uniref:F-box domain-containing protein n=1 Tax=Aspergillus pseudodeflectus TaxID=176178 RepID=A0ABR4JS46_9EURO